MWLQLNMPTICMLWLTRLKLVEVVRRDVEAEAFGSSTSVPKLARRDFRRGCGGRIFERVIGASTVVLCGDWPADRARRHGRCGGRALVEDVGRGRVQAEVEDLVRHVARPARGGERVVRRVGARRACRGRAGTGGAAA